MKIRVRSSREAKAKPLLRQNSRLLEIACVQLLFASLGALAGSAELIFHVHPFGVALAAAATALFPAVSLGAAIFYIVTQEYVTLVAIGLTVAARLFLCFYPQNGAKKAHAFTERISYRVLIAALALFSTGLFRIIRGGFRFFDLFALLLGVLAAGLATLLFSGIFEKKDRLFSHSREVGVAALVLTCIFAMRSVSFFGVYPSAVVAALASFWLVAHRGVSLGTVGGALAGLCFDIRMAPAFLLCGLCFGLLEKSSRGGGILAGSGAAAIYAFAVARTAGITLILPALLTAGALFLAGDSAGLVEGSPGYRLTLTRRRAALQSAKAGEQAESETQVRELSGALLDLSSTFFELSSRLRRPGLMDLRHLCDKAFDEACPGCRNRDICWGTEYHATASTVGALGSRLHASGAVGKDQIPSDLAARCTRLPSILKSINEGALRLSEEALRGDKTSVVATDYAAIGRILGETLEDSRDAFVTDAAAGERILERLQRLGYVMESVAVCGKKHRRVILRGIRLPGRHLKVRELRQVLEQHCRFALGVPEIVEADGASDMVFPERTKYGSVTVKETRVKSKSEGRYCGDSVMTLSTDKGYDYAFLCDGMGSGNHAALTSALASTFLARMLRAGSRADTALRMLNGFLAARGSRETESSTTVDLLEIDRVSGEASLFKCGAAVTYLLRRGEITRFSSRTAPVGILESLDAERIRFSVNVGDILIQVSDGVTKGEEDCSWLAEMLSTKWDGDAETFARLVLGRAAQEGNDDLSIMVTEITRAREQAEELGIKTDRASA